MQVIIKTISENITKLTISADAKDLAGMKQHVLKKLAPTVKMPGFRDGKVPPALAEKQLGNQLQGEVLEEAINHFYGEAIAEKRLRVVSQPKVEISKFVPYTQLEFTAEVEVIGKVSLPEYKNIKVKKAEVKVVVADINEILDRLQKQSAVYTTVDRAAKTGDRVNIDFDGTDAKGQLVNGAKGKDFPLTLGSNAFIHGFEDNLTGLKAGAEKSFTVPFPNDYHLKALQSKKVTFKVKVNKIEVSKLEPVDDAFAAKVGPFKNLEELKTDIKKQLKLEKDNQAQRELEDNIIKSLMAKTKVLIPPSLLEQQMDSLDAEFKQNLTYRGETFNEYLENNALSEQEYRDKELKPAAEDRLKAGLALSEVAEAENISVTPEEVEIRIQILKGQYSDAAMKDELDKPEARRDIASRLLTEKTIAKLVSYTSKTE